MGRINYCRYIDKAACASCLTLSLHQATVLFNTFIYFAHIVSYSLGSSVFVKHETHRTKIKSDKPTVSISPSLCSPPHLAFFGRELVATQPDPIPIPRVLCHATVHLHVTRPLWPTQGEFRERKTNERDILNFELNVYLFLKTVEQSKHFKHEKIWISRIGGTTRSLGAWKVKSTYKVHVYNFYT